MYKYKYLKYKKKYIDKKKFNEFIIDGGKCSESSLSNLKIIKAHGSIYKDKYFIVPPDVKIIALVSEGETLDMKLCLEMEFLYIFKQNAQDNFFDLTTQESTTKEKEFEKLIFDRFNVKYTIQKYLENSQIIDHKIQFTDSLTGIFCTNNNFTACFPLVYGEKIHNSFNKKDLLLKKDSIVRENIYVDNKYVNFVPNESIKFKLDDIKLSGENIYVNQLNRIHLIIHFATINGYTLQTLEMQNPKYKYKNFSFILKQNINERYGVNIEGEQVLIKGDKLYLIDSTGTYLSIEQIMALDENVFLNKFAINVPTELADIDETKYIENKYNRDTNGIFISADDPRGICVSVLKCEIIQLSLHDLIQLEGSGIYILYICRQYDQ